jgi:hypothetical protein
MTAAMGNQIRPITGEETKDIVIKSTEVGPEIMEQVLKIRTEYGLPTGK